MNGTYIKTDTPEQIDNTIKRINEEIRKTKEILYELTILNEYLN